MGVCEIGSGEVLRWTTTRSSLEGKRDWMELQSEGTEVEEDHGGEIGWRADK